jgi:putative MFS transporter
LIRGRFAKRTLVNTSYWLIGSFAAGANGLLYVVLVREGFSLQTTLTFGIIATLATLSGYWVSAYLLERVGRKPTLFAYPFVAAIGSFTVVRTLDPAAIVAILLVLNFCLIGSVGAIYTYIAEQYPTDIRATATAWVNTVTRLAVASGAVVAGVVIDLLGPESAFTVSAALLCVSASIVVIFGLETRGMSLDEIQGLK